MRKSRGPRRRKKTRGPKKTIEGYFGSRLSFVVSRAEEEAGRGTEGTSATNMRELESATGQRHRAETPLSQLLFGTAVTELRGRGR